MKAEIKNTPLYIDQVYAHLLDAIAFGGLKAGERVRQAALSDALGVSRQPVSHALQMLKRQGLVCDAGRQGVAVAPIDPHHVRQLYEARQALEVLAATRAAQGVADGTASATATRTLKAALAHGERLAAGNAALTDLVRADAAFHMAVYACSQNPVLGEMLADRWPHFTRAMVAVLDEPGVPQRAWVEHRGIADAILAGDAQGAGALIARHLERAGADVFARLTHKLSLAA